jgi:DNA-directed RNA polymerase subunit RPC12/RpoP
MNNQEFVEAISKEKLLRCDECGNELTVKGPFAQAAGTLAPVEVRVPYICMKCDYEMRLVVPWVNDGVTDNVPIHNANPHNTIQPVTDGVREISEE